MSNKIGNKIKYKKKPNDVIYTPKAVAELMISMCNIEPHEKVLDPSRGKGVFFNNLPECNKDWCEITDGVDFFTYNKPVDVIVGNPPYSLWTKWLKKTLELNPNRFCYIFGAMNTTPKRLKSILDKGYIVKKMCVLQVDWWFGTQFILYFVKGDISENILEVAKETYSCDICNKHCYRGRYGNNPNECCYVEGKIKRSQRKDGK
tara:strand:- start:764 stop:1375 length:612 start_codon:yes stop_codon:yes gene_type:complete